MTTAETEKKIARLEAQNAELAKRLEELASKTNTANTWKPFGDFTRDNRMSVTRLKSLAAKGLIEVDKSSRFFLYRWAA